MPCAIIEIKVVPRSAVSKFTLSEGVIKMHLTSPPVDGAANAECIKVIAKKVGIAKTYVSIVSGEKSKIKRIKIDGLDEEEVIKRLLEEL